MAVATGAALRHALDLAETLEPDAQAMQAEIAATRGTMLAEAAQFALAAHMPRPEAQALVKAAAADLAPRRGPRRGACAGTPTRRSTGTPSPTRARHTGAASALIDRVLARL